MPTGSYRGEGPTSDYGSFKPAAVKFLLPGSSANRKLALDGVLGS